MRPLLCLMCLLLKRDSMSKFTSWFVERNRIFWIFCMKSVELVMCDSDFPVRGCSVRARKWDKLYVGEYGANNRSGMFGLCTFGIVLVGEDM